MGVPQGLVLGPLLFTLFINDLPDCLRSAQAIMYANDTAILVRSKSLLDAECIINSELENVHKWFVSNKLTLNMSKTKYILFRSPYKARNTIPIAVRIRDTEINRVETISYLGVILDEPLNWRPHIDNLRKKLSYACFILAKCRRHFDFQTMRTVYFSIFHSHL